MKKQNSPHARFSTIPFVNGFTDIETENTTFTIGSSQESENIFRGKLPDYIQIHCKLLSKAEFPDTTISAGYRITPNGENLIMHKKLYNGSEVSLKGVVSEVIIEFIGTDMETKNLYVPENPIIYRKIFSVQSNSMRIANYPEKKSEQREIFTTRSEAHNFAGHYYDGIKFSDIQPSLFFVGTDERSTPYLRVVTAREAIQNDRITISNEVSPSSLSTLEDDVCNGLIKINIDGTAYSSISAKKETLTSNIFVLHFKKD